MTTPDIASLPAKWREEAEIHARMSEDRQWAEWLRGEHAAKAARLRVCADELEAALASPAGEGGLPPLPSNPAVFDPGRFGVAYSPEQMRAYGEQCRLATPEQPGSSVDGKGWQQRCLDLGFKYWRAPDAHGVECTHEQARALLRDLLGVEVDFTTPPPAPAAEHIADACKKVQPEARGVEGMVMVPRVKLLALADMLYDNRTTTDSGLPVTVLERIDVAQAAAQELRRYATPNPVRAEQPEGKWKLVPVEETPEMVRAGTLGGMLTPNQAVAAFQSMCSAAPAAPAVGVDALANAAGSWGDFFKAYHRAAESGLAVDWERAAEKAMQWQRRVSAALEPFAKAAALAPDGGERKDG